jgi:hypothetical protein
MDISAFNRKAPGDRLSKLHPSNGRAIGDKAPSMWTAGLHGNQVGKQQAMVSDFIPLRTRSITHQSSER